MANSAPLGAACSTCRFYNDLGPDTMGECRRYPEPVDVHSFHWCGEWRETEVVERRRERDSMHRWRLQDATSELRHAEHELFKARADRLVLGGMPSLFDLGWAARRAHAHARIAAASERVELARARLIGIKLIAP